MTWGNPPAFVPTPIIPMGQFIISRQQAKANGAKRYFTGIPCLYGHTAERTVSSCDCVECHTKLSRERGRRDVVKIVDRFKQRVYGISPQQFADMIWAQSNKCLVCENAFDGHKAPHLDHCHKTGTVRGILCHRCNTGLGLFKDDIARLEKAINYLRKHDGVE